MVHVAVNKYDFEKINILEYAFGEGGGGHQKAYAMYAFINVDNCERPLNRVHIGAPRAPHLDFAQHVSKIFLMGHFAVRLDISLDT